MRQHKRAKIATTEDVGDAEARKRKEMSQDVPFSPLSPTWVACVLDSPDFCSVAIPAGDDSRSGDGLAGRGLRVRARGMATRSRKISAGVLAGVEGEPDIMSVWMNDQTVSDYEGTKSALKSGRSWSRKSV